MIWLLFFITIIGTLMTIAGAYGKKQMMLADSFKSAKNAQARRFIDELIKIAHGDFWLAYKLVQAVLIFGLLSAIAGGTALMACILK